MEKYKVSNNLLEMAKRIKELRSSFKDGTYFGLRSPLNLKKDEKYLESVAEVLSETSLLVGQLMVLTAVNATMESNLSGKIGMSPVTFTGVLEDLTHELFSQIVKNNQDFINSIEDISEPKEGATNNR